MADFSKYKEDFEKIFQFSNVKRKENDFPKNRYECRDCKIPTNLDLITDYYICPSCGLCEKTDERYFGFNKYPMNFMHSNKYEAHHIKRLIINMKKMGIYDEDVINSIRKRFSIIEDYYANEYSNTKRKNIIRYAYLIIKILELLECPKYLNYKFLPVKKTLKKYDKIWNDICTYAGWKFVPSVR